MCIRDSDKVAADIFFKGGIILGAHDDAALVVQHDEMCIRDSPGTVPQKK